MRETSRLGDESGFSIVEALVAAMVLIIASIGILGALEATGAAGAQERLRSQAYQLAQQDQARMRAMKITQLIDYNQSRDVTVDTDEFTITSSSQFVTDSTSTQSCDTGTAAADYLTVTSTVTWPSIGERPEVKIESIIAPPTSTFAEDRGALAIAVRDAAGNGIPGIGLSGSGAGTFSGPTGSNGCAIFANLPEGNYNVTPSASGYVDKDGNAAVSLPTSVIAQATNSVALQLDRPGSLEATFRIQTGTSTFEPSMSDSIVVSNTGMTSPKSFGTVGNRVARITASPLFPFTSDDIVYAGACTGNNPMAASPFAPAAQASVRVNAGGPVGQAVITLPQLNLTVYDGWASWWRGNLVGNARVTITDKNCSISGTPVKRITTTGTSGDVEGKLVDPGLPYSTYDVCVSNGSRRYTATNVAVKNTSTPANLTIYLSGSGSQSGNCP